MRREVDSLRLHPPDGVIHRGKKPRVMQFHQQPQGADDAQPRQAGSAWSAQFVNHHEGQSFLLCGLDDGGLACAEPLKKRVGRGGARRTHFTPGCGLHARGGVILQSARDQFGDDLGGNDEPPDDARELVKVRQAATRAMSGLLLPTSEGFTGMGELLL